MDEPRLSQILLVLSTALGLGLLVGLERESVKSRTAGLRTFGFTTLAGALAGLLASSFGALPLVAGLLFIAVLVVVSNYVKVRAGDVDPGMTTEIALLVMYLVGAWLAVGEMSIGVVVGGTVAVLLHSKNRFQKLMERLGRDDIRAIMRFALLALVILPILPDREYGPYDVINPFEIWMLVVLIVGISLSGYIAYRFFGSGARVLTGGLLGGVISSTATAVSYARRTGRQPDSAVLSTVVILISTAVVLVRVMIEIAIVSRAVLPRMILPFVILFVVSTAVAGALWWRSRGQDSELPEQENPAELAPAMMFGFLYALVLLGVAWTRQNWGATGVYALATVAGLTDVDAITLSNASLAAAGQLPVSVAWRAIVVAFISNLAFKAAICGFLGGRELLLRVGTMFLIIGAVAAGLVVFWP